MWSPAFHSSVSGQQKTWVLDALAHSTFAWDNASMTVMVEQVDEPPCSGHQDYMCTQVADGQATIFVRRRADDPTAPFNQGLPNPATDTKPFFEESIIHELGHAFFFLFFGTDDDKAAMAPWFYRASTGDGQGNPTGTVDDWNPLDKVWADRIQEGLAETFKDVYMPDAFRVYENRSNWWLDQASFPSFLTKIEQIICPDFIGVE